MARINHTLLGLFRHQLWLEHIEVLEEFKIKGSTAFAIKNLVLDSWSLLNLQRVARFKVCVMAFDGNFKLHLLIEDDD